LGSRQKIESVANELGKILADEYVLYTKTRNTLVYRRSDFSNKHKFFEAQFGELDGIMVARAHSLFTRTYVDAM
jgi:starvation-inducible DNA-binding protein